MLIEEITINTINIKELEDLIRMVYGIDLDLVFINELCEFTGTYLKYYIDPCFIDEDDMIIDEETSLDVILADLCIKGYVESGEYYLKVDYN